MSNNYGKLVSPQDLLFNNRKWIAERLQDDPDYFTRLAAPQRPRFMWIGCSDARIHPNEIIGLEAGEIFVHRNVANQVLHADLNLLSALQYAVDDLGVEHVIVTGHYDCGGVQAAMEPQQFGLVDTWIRGIRDTYQLNQSRLDSCVDAEKFDRLCEYNVIRQVENLSHCHIIQRAWARGQHVSIRGWIYRFSDGMMLDLGVEHNSPDSIPAIFRTRVPVKPLPLIQSLFGADHATME